jgi:hypothetical protein
MDDSIVSADSREIGKQRCDSFSSSSHHLLESESAA